MSSWSALATQRMTAAGYRRGGARAAVIGVLDREGCALSAYGIADALRDQDGRSVGRASIYRILEELESLHLVTRVDVGSGTARYEATRPGGHHHHMVCDTCGEVFPFEDADLERAVDRVAKRVPFAVAEHEIVLHGACADCQE